MRPPTPNTNLKKEKMIAERKMDIDVMILKGEKYYGRFKGFVRSHVFITEQGTAKWKTTKQEMETAVLRRFPSLRGRKDIVLFENQI